MTFILLSGALVGLGLLVLGLVLAPPKPNPAAALVELDAARGRVSAERLALARLDPGQTLEPKMLRDLGGRVRDVLAKAGLEFGSLRSDLAMVGRSWETHLAISLLAAVGGFVAPVVIGAALAVIGAGTTFGSASGLVGIGLALAGAILPSALIRPKAEQRRKDFRHAIGSFVDLVAMNLAGGRGVPEALQTASEVSDGWAMIRIRDTLLTARLHGVTPWSALGELGKEVRVDELVDLASALTLVAEDGAKVRESLAARATSMRKRELAEAEGRAGERSQSMLVAQLVLCVGFLIFLVYPAIVRMLGT